MAEQLAQLVHEVERLLTAPYVPSLQVSRLDWDWHWSIHANTCNTRISMIWCSSANHLQLAPGYCANPAKLACWLMFWSKPYRDHASLCL